MVTKQTNINGQINITTKIYTNIEQIGCSSGRFSFHSPNLANIQKDLFVSLISTNTNTNTNTSAQNTNTNISAQNTNTDNSNLSSFSVRRAFVPSPGCSLLSVGMKWEIPIENKV
jgi:hypothetical protein